MFRSFCHFFNAWIISFFAGVSIRLSSILAFCCYFVGYSMQNTIPLGSSPRSWPSLLQTMSWVQPKQLSEHELCNLLKPQKCKKTKAKNLGQKRVPMIPMLFEMPLTFLRVSETVIFRTLAKDHLSWGSLGSPAAQCRCCETIHQPHGRRQEVQRLLFSSKSIISNGLLCFTKKHGTSGIRDRCVFEPRPSVDHFLVAGRWQCLRRLSYVSLERLACWKSI